MDMKMVRIVLIGVLSIMMVALMIAIGLLVRDLNRANEPQAIVDTAPIIETPLSTNASTESSGSQAATPTVITEGNIATLPPPFVQELPTQTPLPSVTPTDTPPPTETLLPTTTATNTAVPPTNAPLPTAVPPTATPVPLTATPSGPQPTIANGLQGGGFALQDWRTSLTPGGQIWYEWTVVNTTGSGVPYSTIGVMPRRNGQDIVAWYQNNWGGNNDVMPPEGLSWPSWLSIPEAGDYTLRVVVCFDGYQTCITGGGTFYTLSQEIAVTIR